MSFPFPFIPPKGGGDPSYSSVVLLLHGDGTNGSTTFTDNSPTPKTGTANGNAVISTSQSKYGGASMSFDGSGDWVSFADSADWDLTGDFTIEFWFNLTTLSRQNTFMVREDGSGNAEIMLRIDSTNAWDVFIRTGTGGDTIIGRIQVASGVSTGTWYHVAFVRSGSNFYLFQNGTQLGTASSASAGSNTAFAITVGGRAAATTEGALGYIDDFRITKGVGRYTSGFTAPTAAFPNS